MSEKKSLFQNIFVMILILFLSLGSAHFSIDPPSQKGKESEKSFSTSFSKIKSSSKITISYPRESASRFQSLANAPLKIFRIFTSCSLLFKGGQRETFLILLTQLQYFIQDLDVHILSSRSHPPTA